MSRTSAAPLRAESLSFSYDQGRPLLRQWSAEFHSGTTTAITGPSGRGKSTLLYLLGLMLGPHSGEVVVHGQNAARLSDAVRARTRAHSFGFVFQDAALDATRSVLDNITEASLYRRESRTRSTARALALMGQFGVDVDPTRKPGQISGGQAQRIALCRALIGDPAIVLADEPTGNLDPDSARIVMQALADRASDGAAVVIVTHSDAITQACDIEVRL